MRDPENNIMKNVKINKDELLQIVRDNKEKHIKDYNESVDDYTRLAYKIAMDNITIIETKDLEKIKNKVKPIPATPVSYEDSYTRAIRMLELSVEDIIEVDAHTFNQLVLDEWQWKQQFTTTSSFYKSSM